MFGLTDDMIDMRKGLRETRKILKKAYAASQEGNAKLAEELMKQADKAALNSLDMLDDEDQIGLGGEVVKADWQK
jgi:hypothetical protein